MLSSESFIKVVKFPQQELGASFGYKRKTSLSPSGSRYISRQESGVLCGLIITVVIIFLAGYILKITWTSQIDVPKSIQKILQKPMESLPKINDFIATR